MVAIQSIAQTLGIKVIAGVNDNDQLANLPGKDFRFGYDAFWENWECRRTAHFYEIPASLPQAALEDTQARNRWRRRKKREFKSNVGVEIAGRLGAIFPGHRETAA